MRLLFLLIIVFSQNIFAEDAFQKAKVLFNDGHTEEGFISSFLEKNKIYGTLEKNLNLDDKSFKFKITETAEIKEIFTINVKQVTLLGENNNDEVYEVVLLKELDKEGFVLQDGAQRVYLNPVKKGKINVYGIKYSERYVRTGKDMGYTEYFLGGKEYFFYYQNTKENYAINYFNVGMGSVFKLKIRMLNPLKEMYKDCPSALEYINKNIDEDNIDKKAMKAHDKLLKAEFKELTDDKKNDLKIIHYYQCFEMDELINVYQKCN
jgi:hypothetical protein